MKRCDMWNWGRNNWRIKVMAQMVCTHPSTLACAWNSVNCLLMRPPMTAGQGGLDRFKCHVCAATFHNCSCFFVWAIKCKVERDSGWKYWFEWTSFDIIQHSSSFLGKAGVKGTEGLSHPRDVPENSSHCLPCQAGCDFCKDNTPCVARGEGALRIAVLSFQGLCMLLDFISMVLLYHFRRNKVSVCCRRELIKMATVSMKHILFLLTLGCFHAGLHYN